MHSLCSSYHWSYEQALQRTLPQIIMLNYSAWREQKNAEKRAKAKVAKDRDKNENDPFLPEYGVRRSELEKDPDLWEQYLTDWS